MWASQVPASSAKNLSMITGRISLCVALCLSLSVLEPAEAVERVASQVPFFENLGTLHHPITTRSKEAQRYFDQGLRLVYAFNHEEAIRAFEEAARLDPSAAMAYWGIALALGPNINAGMDKTDERRAWEALQKARSYSAHVTPAEQAYLQAISTRYSLKGPTRAALDKAYADAMRVLWKQFTEDPDAGALFAEALMDLHPWDLWTVNGKPKSGTEEIVSTLEAVLARAPNHPGACHYYIHAMEASPTPERALACAERLPALMPGAGHLVHMPAHIHMRLGRYHEAAEHNAQAAEIDRHYLAGRSSTGDEAEGYYRHNLHFLWASLLMEGRSAEAMKVARQLTATMREADIRRDSSQELYLPVPLWTMIRFGQWEALLRELPPPNTFRLKQAIWRLGRGMALGVIRVEYRELRESMPHWRRWQNDLHETGQPKSEPSGPSFRSPSDCLPEKLPFIISTMTRQSQPFERPSNWRMPCRIRSHRSGPFQFGTIWVLSCRKPGKLKKQNRSIGPI